MSVVSSSGSITDSTSSSSIVGLPYSTVDSSFILLRSSSTACLFKF
nr:MAG TPA: hypothetical protein [Bacteriophage sp.]